MMMPCREEYRKVWPTTYSGYRLGANSDSDRLFYCLINEVRLFRRGRLTELQWNQGQVTEVWRRISVT